MVSWQGRQAIDLWYVPDTYEYPNMPWADPAIGPITAAGGVAGEMNVQNVSGNTVIGRRGTGITSEFLDYALSDGSPVTKEETIFFPQGLTTRRLSYVKESDVGGVPTNTFAFEFPDNLTVVEDEERQRNGEMPFARLQNMRYSKGAAGIVGPPNYYGVDESIYTQSSNTDKFAGPGGGISMYRTRDGYSSSSALLDTPVLMTASSVAEFSGEWNGYTKIEPASGVSLETQLHNMASVFTWNCNPQIDQTCGLLASPYDANDPLCYNFGVGTHMPCSNANVFTPKVRGGKVLPLLWNRAVLKPDGAEEQFLKAMDIRLFLAIMCLIFPILFLLTFAITRPTLCCPGSNAKVSTYSPPEKDDDEGDVENAALVHPAPLSDGNINTVEPIEN